MKTNSETQINVLKKAIQNIRDGVNTREDIEIYSEDSCCWKEVPLYPTSDICFEFERFEYRVKPKPIKIEE